MKNSKAFTVTELLVTVAMIFLLVTIWFFYGRGHIKIAKLNEGRMFIDLIIAQEKNYYSAKKAYYGTYGYVKLCNPLYISTKNNKYFSSFNIVPFGQPTRLRIVVKDSTKQGDTMFDNIKIEAVYDFAEDNFSSYKEYIK